MINRIAMLGLLLIFSGTGYSLTIWNAQTVNITSNTTYDEDVTIYGELNIGNGDGTNDTLTINGTLLNYSGTINIQDDGVIIVNGNFNNESWLFWGSDAESAGELIVTGNVHNEGGSAITVPDGGSIKVGGNFDNDGEVTVDGSGSLNVGGTYDDTGGTTNTTGGGSISENLGKETALPIELVYFNASSEGNQAVLYWQTATELNNDFFTIEHSSDGITYTEIAIVNGAGNSSATMNYTHTHNTPNNGVNYYRLTQTDYDGKYEVFNAVSVSVNLATNFEAKVWPNPTSDYINITLNGVSDNGTLSLISITGAIVTQLFPTSSNQQINVSSLSKGTYFLIYQSGENQILKQILVE